LRRLSSEIPTPSTATSLTYSTINRTVVSKIILIDGQRLAQLMIDFNVGVTTEAIYELKRVDADYFAEE